MARRRTEPEGESPPPCYPLALCFRSAPEIMNSWWWSPKGLNVQGLLPAPVGKGRWRWKCLSCHLAGSVSCMARHVGALSV